MREWLMPAVGLAFLTAAGGALADTVAGVIAEIDEADAEVVLESGQRFTLSGASIEGIRPGDTVEIEFTEDDEGLQATKIVKM